ncbi:hypothetical protein H4I96_11923 [Botrytis cinerea]
MAPITFPIISSRSLPNKIANSTSSIIKLVTQSSAAFSAHAPSLAPVPPSSTLPSKSPISTALPDLFREQSSTIIVDAPPLLTRWIYMMKAKRNPKKRRKGKGKEKEVVQETVKVRVKANKRKHRKHKKHRKTEAETVGGSGGEAPAAEGA